MSAGCSMLTVGDNAWEIMSAGSTLSCLGDVCLSVVEGLILNIYQSNFENIFAYYGTNLIPGKVLC